jgi:hypothetical protein
MSKTADARPTYFAVKTASDTGVKMESHCFVGESIRRFSADGSFLAPPPYERNFRIATHNPGQSVNDT